VYTPFAWIPWGIIKLIIIIIIIDVKHHAIIRDTGDGGYWRYRYTRS
jgi:hypothetical protein